MNLHISAIKPGARARYRAGKSQAKYRAVKTVVDGVTFASKKEARRYQELRLLEKASEIEELELQPRFVLNAASTSGQFSRAIQAVAGTLNTKVGEYRADFKYHDVRKGRWIVEDVKGYDVPLGRWKRKHCEIQYGITVILT